MFEMITGADGNRTIGIPSDRHDSQGIDTVDASANESHPLRNPPNPRFSDNVDDYRDDSIDVDRLRELVTAAAALAPAGGPCAVLLAEVTRALDPVLGATWSRTTALKP